MSVPLAGSLTKVPHHAAMNSQTLPYDLPATFLSSTAHRFQVIQLTMKFTKGGTMKQVTFPLRGNKLLKMRDARFS